MITITIIDMKNEKRIRHTKQRQAILEVLEQFERLERHPSADELYLRVRRRLPRISLGTVYRNLEALARDGTIARLAQGGARARFDARSGAHGHIRCVICGRIDDIPSVAPIPEKDRRAARAAGYRLLDRRVQYLGVCAACRAKDGKD